MFHKLKQDEQIINSIIKRYLLKSNNLSKIPLETRFREWGHAKKNLYNLLGQQLIAEMPDQEFSLSEETLLLLMENFIDSEECAYAMGNVIKDFSIENKDILNSNNIYRHLYNAQALLKNKYEGPQFTIGQIKISQGMKITKILKILAELASEKDEYILELYEDFRIEHSKILQMKKLRGTLCLSIHPLDFITMSDNSYNWKSCMSWEDVGCYRTGTLEMMNSPIVLVAYLKGSKEYKGWNSKKWRTLLIVTEEGVIDIKGYPFADEVLSKACLSWVRELANKNLGIDYYDEIVKYDFSDNEQNEDVARGFINCSDDDLSVTSDYMYSDLYSYHWGLINDTKQWNGLEINYSGTPTCIDCGDPVVLDFNLDSDSDSLWCLNCRGVKTCEMCEGLYLSTNSDSSLCPTCQFQIEHNSCICCNEYYHDQMKVFYTNHRVHYICPEHFKKFKDEGFIEEKGVWWGSKYELTNIEKFKQIYPDIYKKLLKEGEVAW